MTNMPINNIIPPSGTPYTIQFKINNLKPLPISSLEFHKDINSPINGGNITTPLDMQLYKKIKVNQTFTLSWNWKTPTNQKSVRIMTGYLSSIHLGKNSIEIEFTDKGSRLRKQNKLKYTKKPRLHIIHNIIQKTGLKPQIDKNSGAGDIIDYDGGSDDIKGKSYEDMLKELIEGSTTDLATLIQDNTCKIVNLQKIAKNKGVPIHDRTNVLKDSVTIDEIASESSNHITLYYKDNTHKSYITNADKASITRYGKIRDSIEKTEIKTASQARAYTNKLLRKNSRENGFQINLSIIASPYYNILTPCTVKLEKYNINRNLVISCLNFKLTAGKTPTMDLTLNDYTPPLILNIEKHDRPTVAKQKQNTGNVKYQGNLASLASSLGDPAAIRRWIDSNIKYQFYYNKRKSPNGVLKDKRGNCMDQTDLAVAMMKHIGYNAWRVCGIHCKQYSHCNGKVKIKGRIITFDTTCSSLNKL